MHCIVLHMAASANNISLDLLELYKSVEVNRITTFCDVTAQLDPGNLATAYARARDSAPRRHDRNKRYFVDHSGQTNRSENSNRREEHLALALWGASQSGSPMVLPTGETLGIVDYQTPLKARQSDKGVGKVDLFGIGREKVSGLFSRSILDSRPSWSMSGNTSANTLSCQKRGRTE